MMIEFEDVFINPDHVTYVIVRETALYCYLSHHQIPLVSKYTSAEEARAMELILISKLNQGKVMLNNTNKYERE